MNTERNAEPSGFVIDRSRSRISQPFVAKVMSGMLLCQCATASREIGTGRSR